MVGTRSTCWVNHFVSVIMSRASNQRTTKAAEPLFGGVLYLCSSKQRTKSSQGATRLADA